MTDAMRNYVYYLLNLAANGCEVGDCMTLDDIPPADRAEIVSVIEEDPLYDPDGADQARDGGEGYPTARVYRAVAWLVMTGWTPEAGGVRGMPIVAAALVSAAALQTILGIGAETMNTLAENASASTTRATGGGG